MHIYTIAKPPVRLTQDLDVYVDGIFAGALTLPAVKVSSFVELLANCITLGHTFGQTGSVQISSRPYSCDVHHLTFQTHAKFLAHVEESHDCA